MITATVKHERVLRILLVFMGVPSVLIGLWAGFAPRGFYDDFPGAGAHWVSALPPYNEHLERDFGAASLGIAVLTGLAAYWMDRRVIQAAALTLIAAGLPHLIYHLTTTGHYSTGDNVASLFGLALDVVLPLGILYLVSDSAQRPITRPAEPKRV